MEFNTLPCRTCGNPFSFGQDMEEVKPIIVMVEILEQLSAWNLQVAPEDGLPQYMCHACFVDFQKVLKLKCRSLETQAKFIHMRSLELYVAPVNKSSGIKHIALSDVTFQKVEPKIPGPAIGSRTDKMEIKPEDSQCHICAKHFPLNQESRFKFHMKWHKLEHRLKCPMCRFFCRSKALLNDHKRSVHPLVKCTRCNQNIRKHLLHRHINKHLEKRQPEMANKPRLLQQPAVKVSPVASAKVASPLTVTSPDLRAPAATVAAPTENAPPAPAVPRRYSLRVASATRGSSSPLKPSKQQQVVPRKSYLCCDKSFGRKTELVQHLKRHTHPRI